MSKKAPPKYPVAGETWSEDYIAEHAYLIERGVRSMAIVGHIEAEPLGMLRAFS